MGSYNPDWAPPSTTTAKKDYTSFSKQKIEEFLHPEEQEKIEFACKHF
ncbi:hypothetical protein [Aeribacillus composti]